MGAWVWLSYMTVFLGSSEEDLSPVHRTASRGERSPGVSWTRRYRRKLLGYDVEESIPEMDYQIHTVIYINTISNVNFPDRIHTSSGAFRS